MIHQHDYPGAWLYFICFIMSSTFVVLNLFIAVIGNSIQDLRGEQGPDQALGHDIRALRSEVAVLSALIKAKQGLTDDHPQADGPSDQVYKRSPGET